MKKIFLLCTVCLALVGCKTQFPVAQETGKADMAYLLFVGTNKDDYRDKTVEVTIDDNAPFTANVVWQKRASRRGTQYGIGTGNCNLKVTCNGKVVYEKKVFLSAQETKQIILPAP